MQTPWWAVARSEEVNDKKPLSVDIGDRPIVVWRDRQGIARALEDRCPHRRAPLSLGCVRGDGSIRCGYHGWTYDGASGSVIDIPNLKDQKRFPRLYKAERFAVHESGGFVRLCLDQNAAPPAASEKVLPLGGTAFVSLDHKRYLAAFFDDPSLLLTIRSVHFTTYLMAELHEKNARLEMERSCQWKMLHWPAAFSAEFPLALLTSTDPVTGETDLILRDRDLRALLTMTMAPVPAARGVTAVRWRAKVEDRLSTRALLSGGRPVKVHDTVDGAALRELKSSVSVVLDNLRSTITRADDCVA